MNGEFKQCPNGHYYQGEVCPYCKTKGNATSSKTEVFVKTWKICYLMMVVMIIIMSSCASGTNGGGRSKEKYLKNYTSLVEEFEATYTTLTEEKFDAYMTEFDLYAGEYFEQHRSELTEEERQYVGRLSARADKIIYGKKINDAQNKVNDMIDVASGYLDEILK